MTIGVDFDNTIVCYDRIFHRAAVEAGLIPAVTAARKAAVRSCLVEQGREDAWTELQGHVYGARMLEAEPFPGVLEFFEKSVREGLAIYIISHKTRFPFVGPRHDLHGAAHAWLEHHGFYDEQRIGLGRSRVFLELTKEEKLRRIDALSCTHFIDDLPEILNAVGFPNGVERLLFDPSNEVPSDGKFVRVRCWEELAQRESATLRAFR